MIRKLFAGVSVVAIAAVALLLMTVGTSAKAKPAEATVATIGATVSSTGVNQFMLVQVDAQDNFWDFPNSKDDLDITASAGEFLELDPTGLAPGCTDQGGSPDSFRCRVNSNGFAQSNTFAPNPGSGGNTAAVFNDTLSILNSFATGTTHIQVCNVHPQTGADPARCDNNTSHVEAWWQAPPGFLGGTVTFCATQANTVCTNKTVVGPIASLTLKAFRHDSTETSSCTDTPVFVIAAAEYTFNDFTTFNNNRAILCAEARDSNGTLVMNQNLVWTTTKGALGSNTTNTGATANVNNSNNTLTSGSTAHSGDIATVTVQNGSATASTTVQFGGDPASCALKFDPDKKLAIGDTGHITATFLDAKGNWVPDGIVAHMVLTNSGNSSGNASLVSATEDTVKGNIQGDAIASIAGNIVVAASIEHIAGPDTTCSDELELTGNIHTVPIVCSDPSGILNGFPPPAGGGFGTFEFCGGTFDQLFQASKCPPPQATSQSAFFYNRPQGDFIVWIPGSQVAAVNAQILALWPEQIPPGTIFTAKCK